MMSEVERHRPWGDSVPVEFVLASDYDQLKEAYEGAESQAEYQRERAEHFMVERDQLKTQLWHSEMAATAEAHYADELKAERDTLRKQLIESQANDRCAMAYLADVRAVVGGTDFVCMVHNVTQMKRQLDEAKELLNDSRNKINYMRQNGERYQPQFLLGLRLTLGWRRIRSEILTDLHTVW